MDNLFTKAIGGFLALMLFLAALIFIPVWTFAYWQGWAFLAVFSLSTLAITLYLMRYDRGLLERRVLAGPVAEKEKSQKIIQSFAQLAFALVVLVPAIDHRYSWSHVPDAASVFGDILVAAGLLAVFFVFRANSYTSATIEVDARQKLVTTGPYAVVRHPMYSGALVMLIGVPLALGSWWGLLALLPITIVIIARLLEEEKFLAKNLNGYANYTEQTKYRLIPFIW